MSQDILNELVKLSNRLGDPALDYIILAEGNTSARADPETFWVKASGREMRTMRPCTVRRETQRETRLAGALLPRPGHRATACV